MLKITVANLKAEAKLVLDGFSKAENATKQFASHVAQAFESKVIKKSKDPKDAVASFGFSDTSKPRLSSVMRQYRDVVKLRGAGLTWKQIDSIPARHIQSYTTYVLNVEKQKGTSNRTAWLGKFVTAAKNGQDSRFADGEFGKSSKKPRGKSPAKSEKPSTPVKIAETTVKEVINWAHNLYDKAQATGLNALEIANLRAADRAIQKAMAQISSTRKSGKVDKNKVVAQTAPAVVKNGKKVAAPKQNGKVAAKKAA